MWESAIKKEDQICFKKAFLILRLHDQIKPPLIAQILDPY